MLLGIDHIVIAGPDLDTLTATFKALGFNVVGGGRHPIGSYNSLIGLRDGAYIELLSFYEDCPQHYWWDAVHSRGGGLIDFCMQTDDIRADYAVFEAQGVAPTVLVPVTYGSLFDGGDPLLEAAEKHLTDTILGELIDGGELSLGVGSSELLATGAVGPDQRVRYRVTLPANRLVSVYLSGEDETVDTVLGIYDGEGARLLGENDDADDETLSSAWTDLEVGAQSGLFVFEARIKNAEEAEAFTIRVVGVAPEAETEDDAEFADDAEETEEGKEATDE